MKHPTSRARTHLRRWIPATAVASSFLLGCAGGPPFVAPESPAPGKALLYLYRPAQLPEMASSYTVRALPDTPLAQLSNRSWQAAEVPAGRLLLQSFTQQHFHTVCPLLDLRLSSGEVRYLKLKIWIEGMRYASEAKHLCRLQDIPAREALEEIRGMPRLE